MFPLNMRRRDGGVFDHASDVDGTARIKINFTFTQNRGDRNCKIGWIINRFLLISLIRFEAKRDSLHVERT